MEPGITESGMWHKTLTCFCPIPMATVGSSKSAVPWDKSLKPQTAVSVAERALLRTHFSPELSRKPYVELLPEHWYFTLFSSKSWKCLPDKDKFSIPLKRKTSWDIRLTVIRDWLPDFWVADYVINMSAQFCSTNMFLSGCWIKKNQPTNKNNNKVIVCW